MDVQLHSVTSSQQTRPFLTREQPRILELEWVNLTESLVYGISLSSTGSKIMADGWSRSPYIHFLWKDEPSMSIFHFPQSTKKEIFSKWSFGHGNHVRPSLQCIMSRVNTEIRWLGWCAMPHCTTLHCKEKCLLNALLFWSN